MKIRPLTYKLLIAVAVCTFAACREKEMYVPTDGPGVELSGLAADVTRAGVVAELKDYVGKDEFDDKDRIVFVTIKRTAFPISQFTYSNLEFECAKTISADGASIGWSRDKTKGTSSAGGEEAHPDRIYWSDATNPHTFTGFCTPQQGVGAKAFDWEKQTVNDREAYYGSIGDPTQTGGANDTIDYRSTFDGSGHEIVSGNIELRKNDILLTHSTEIKAQDAIAKLYFYHGLAQVRVIVNISDFAAGGGDDTKSKVSDMILKNMLTMYKWGKNSVATEQLTSEDQAALNTIYSGSSVLYNQRKNFNLWIPHPEGVGESSSRIFTFYGMVVPTQIATNGLVFSFKVTYPDPMKPTEMKEHTYTASIGDIQFDAGKCTTISISLNHKNEKMTVGAEYDDWEFVQTPDQGELKKNSTFLSSTARTKDKDNNYNVTIVGDNNATVDDATWLFVDPTTQKIVDIYGNDGSSDHPFQISTADQLLSFAYEVKGTNRQVVSFSGLDGTSKSLAAGAGFDFTGYHINLDADITLQKSLTDSTLVWIGIGDASHPFNGVFSAGFRHINRLYGYPFFHTIGPNGIVDHIFISNSIGITGTGSIAEVNNGIICGSHVEGNIVDVADVEYCGSIVGVNTGVLIACSHIGSITGNANVLGALLGKNDGIMVTCYNVGDATNKKAGKPAYAGVGAFTSRSVAYCCYFNKDFYTSEDYLDLDANIGHVAFPLTTMEMQSNKYVNHSVEADITTHYSSDEITDERDKTDMFYWHWSLNAGLRRAIAYLSLELSNQSTQENIVFHAPGTPMTPNTGVELPKTQVQWLIDHFANDSHKFQFIPGTYPRLQ